MAQPRSHNGSALISAIMIMTIVAILATALMVSQRFLIHAANSINTSDHRYLALQSEAALGSVAIKKYAMQWVNAKNKFTPLQNILSIRQVGALNLQGTIENEQGKYNINNLVYAANQKGFVALLQAVIPSISKQTAYHIAQSITDWETTGSQDPYYLSLQPAYRSSKQEMVNISELRLIAGITPQIFHAIAPFVTALPIARLVQSTPANALITPVDINSASPVVLLAVNPNLTLNQAQQFIDCRKEEGGFMQLSQFIATCAKPNGIATVSNVTTQSQYFQVISEAKHNAKTFFLKTLLTVYRIQNATTISREKITEVSEARA